MDAFLRDLRFALRGLARTPGFTAAAVLALALGIGATTAIFSVVHGVLLRSMGWAAEDRLVSVRTDWAGHKIAGFALSVPEVIDLRSAPLFEASGGYSRETAALQGERTERVQVGYTTAGFFDTLGVKAQYGRTFTDAEDLQGNDTVAVLGYAAWRRRFAGDPAVIGRSVTLDGRPYRIVGILPETFLYRDARDFYLPFGFTPPQLDTQRGAHYLEGVARLRPGLDLAQAQKLLDQFSAQVQAAHPDQYAKDAGFRFSIIPLRDRAVGSSRQPLLLLMGAVLLVLLIACGNVANLLLARAATRERELAVRSALGAGRGRLVRQLLTESALLAAAGAVLGVIVALWGLDALIVAAPRNVRDLAQVRADPAVLAFSAGLAIATTLVFGLLPALRSSKPDLAKSLKDGGSSTSVSAGRLRASLVAAQVALSLVLLIGAGLVLRSFAGVLHISPGFDPEGVHTVKLSPAGGAYDGDVARRRYFEQALDAVRAVPGVSELGGIDVLPMEGSYQLSYFIEGYQPAPGEPQPSDAIRRVAPGYFHAMRQRVVAGRELGAGDDAKAPPVALVNEAWVRRYFPGREVVGQRIRLDSKDHGEWRTIVGVVADAREKGLDQPVPPVYYFAAAQLPPDFFTLVVRGGQPAELREAAARVDPSQAVEPPGLLEETVSSSLQPRKFPLQLLGAFAALALVLAALGIYGVTSYAVAQRTREIGVRMAIGATASSVVRMVLAASLRTVVVGLCAGGAAALAFGRVLSSQLYGVSAHDPLTFLSIAALLAAVALLASALPALRAARVDPIAALRAE